MPASTPVYGFPYPIGSDPVRNGDNDIEALAVAVENELVITNGNVTAVTNDVNTFGEWTSFTPTWTNVTIGSGTNSGAYSVINKTLLCRVRFVFGSGSAVSGVPRVTLPASFTMPTPNAVIGDCQFIDASPATNYIGAVDYFDNNEVQLRVHNASSTYTTLTNPSATIPMTWATSDAIVASFVVELS